MLDYALTHLDQANGQMAKAIIRFNSRGQTTKAYFVMSSKCPFHAKSLRYLKIKHIYN